MRLQILILTLALAAVGSAARADPCKAIPDRGPAPKYLHPGAAFSGSVVYIGDGDSLCVAVGSGPENWVEVRLADFYAPELHDAGGAEAKAALSQLAFGRGASCVADHQSHDRIVAVCRINGKSLGDMLRAAGVNEGGRAFHGAEAAAPTPIVVARRASPQMRGVAAGSYYRNCSEARVAAAAPLYRGDPGYRPGLDRDNDGIACEPYRGR